MVLIHGLFILTNANIVVPILPYMLLRFLYLTDKTIFTIYDLELTEMHISKYISYDAHFSSEASNKMVKKYFVLVPE